MKSTKYTIIQLLLLTFVVTSSFYLGLNAEFFIQGTVQWFKDSDTDLTLQSKITDIEKQNIIDNCNGSLGVEEFSNCLVNEIKQFYIYNITNDSIQLTFEELKQRGGDCKDWSELYNELAESSGYDSVTRNYNSIVNVKYGHQWDIVYNETDWCEIDLLGVTCGKAEDTG